MRVGNFGAILLGLLFSAAAILVTGILFGWSTPITNLIQQISSNTLYSAIVAVVLLVLAIFCFSLVRFGEQEQVVISIANKLGQVQISGRTIGEIVTRVGLGVEGIKEVTPGIKPLPEGINIYIRSIVQPDYVIPEVSEELQTLVKQNVEKYTGLKVAEVKVMVQSLDTSGAIRAR